MSELGELASDKEEEKKKGGLGVRQVRLGWEKMEGWVVIRAMKKRIYKVRELAIRWQGYSGIRLTIFLVLIERYSGQGEYS